MKKCIAIGGVALAVTISACGGGAADSPSDVALKFTEAVVHQDGPTACGLMTAKAKKEIMVAAAFLGDGKGCEGLIENLDHFADGDQGLKEWDNPTVAWEKVNGDHARVKLNGLPDDEDPANLRRVNGEWLIDGEQG